jgi:hypothetical protein
MTRKPGQIVLVGALAQGFVSRAIKYGTTLREQPMVAGLASFARWLLRFGVIAAAILYGWSLLGAVAAMVVALVLGVVATWFVAAAFTKGGWSHAALITRVDPDGSVWVTEAVSRGVVEQRFHYGQHNYEIIDPGLDDMSLARVLEFAADVRAARETYGFAQIFGLFLYCVTGTRLCVQWAGTSICSGFVCNALDGAGPDRLHGKLRYTWPRPPFAMMPSDIRDFFAAG